MDLMEAFICFSNKQNFHIGTEWIKNASTTLWRIPHFLSEDLNDIKLTRARLVAVMPQLIINLLIGCFFIRNLTIAFKMVFAHPRYLSNWCCLIPSILGTCGSIMTSAIVYPISGINCRILIWYFEFSISISNLCSGTIVLQNAYLIMRKQRWILKIGIPFMLPQLVMFAVTWSVCPVTLTTHSGCQVNYPSLVLWIWFILLTPINTFFSIIFIYVVHKQYRTFGSDAWRHLARNGTQIMTFVVLCNLFCATTILFNFSGSFSELFFLIDWIITSTLLIMHCQNIKQAVHMSTRPNTRFMVHVSQIETAQTPNSQYLELHLPLSSNATSRSDIEDN
ncbi:hypothetical protein BDF19DRAFT_443817 [Syncephalis fuscata]|nr:hypothetical protein BDF19DRAFT_443817 [Syncephalis fuscata]